MYVYQSLQSTVFPHYNGEFKKSRIKTPTATRIGRYVHFPPLVSIARASVLGPRHRIMQQPSKRKGAVPTDNVIMPDTVIRAR